jgi:hypothetical protein
MGGKTEEIFHSLKLIVSFAKERDTLAKYNELAEHMKEVAYFNSSAGASFAGCIIFVILVFLAWIFGVAKFFVDMGWNNVRTGEEHTFVEVIIVAESMM